MSQDVKVTVTERGGRRMASTGSSWEPIIGYSRAVRIGEIIAVTGCVGLEADGSFAPGMKEQSLRALTIVLAAVESLGGRKDDVIRTRMFVTDISRWREVGEAHGSIFGEIRPATTMVEVAKLIDDAALVEIEADAVIRPAG
ncbi:MAG: putative translation initiation inhibitor, yjgF family [Planctomycetota bacterium]|nr:putative translation initiation inhibitor, yjgF family [Planctomycetota bacterium]